MDVFKQISKEINGLGGGMKQRDATLFLGQRIISRKTSNYLLYAYTTVTRSHNESSDFNHTIHPAEYCGENHRLFVGRFL